MYERYGDTQSIMWSANHNFVQPSALVVDGLLCGVTMPTGNEHGPDDYTCCRYAEHKGDHMAPMMNVNNQMRQIAARWDDHRGTDDIII